MNTRSLLLALAPALLVGGSLTLLACGGSTSSATSPDGGAGQGGDGGGGGPGDGGVVIVVEEAGPVDAGTWVDASPPTQFGSGSAVATTGPTDVWVTGNGPILHYDGTTWTSVFDDSISTFGSLWANSRTDAWAVGYYPGPSRTLGRSRTGTASPGPT